MKVTPGEVVACILGLISLTIAAVVMERTIIEGSVAAGVGIGLWIGWKTRNEPWFGDDGGRME